MDVNKLSKRYARQCILLVVAMTLLGFLVVSVWSRNELVVPLVVSAVFVLVVELATAFVWRWVALKHQDMLPSFFTGASGVRFLGALAVMFVWFLVSERQSMLMFFVVFLIYYMVSLIHHSIFFSKTSNRM